MRARVITYKDLGRLVDLLRREYQVYAPFFGRGRDSYFDLVTDENRDQLQLHIPNPYYPPKRYVLPQIESLMTFTLGKGETRIEPTLDETKRALFGIRSCDVAGIDHLDRY